MRADLIEKLMADVLQAADKEESDMVASNEKNINAMLVYIGGLHGGVIVSEQCKDDAKRVVAVYYHPPFSG